MAVKKVAPIPKKYASGTVSLEASLANHGYYRMPGAIKRILPAKGIDNNYLTGLDEKAAYLNRLSAEEKEAEIERIRETKARLEEKTRLDLGPNSSYYNYAANLPEDRKVSPVKLGTDPVFFNTEDPYQEIAFNWVKVHPAIAPSLQAIERGDVNPSVVQYYVADDELEDKIAFSKKQKLNKAITLLDTLSPTKLRQVARLMGLPAGENTKQETVYNLVDTLLKAGEFKTGEFKGNNPITMFMELSAMNEQRAHTKDLVKQAIASSIYRVKQNDKIFEGENEIASSQEDLVNFLLKDKNQEDLFALEKKLNINKIADLT